MNKNIVINYDEIARLAYQHWERDGRPNGRDREYWLEAEQQLKATKHLLLAEQKMAGAVPPHVNGNDKPAANGNGKPAATKSKARKSSARPAVARF